MLRDLGRAKPEARCALYVACALGELGLRGEELAELARPSFAVEHRGERFDRLDMARIFVQVCA